MTTEDRLSALERAVAGLVELAEIHGGEISRLRLELDGELNDRAIASLTPVVRLTGGVSWGPG